jgi:hypothetical protein
MLQVFILGAFVAIGALFYADMYFNEAKILRKIANKFF